MTDNQDKGVSERQAETQPRGPTGEINADTLAVDAKKSTIGDKIEDTISDFAEFLLTFCRTTAVVAWPGSLVRLVLATVDRPKALVKPLTFLAVTFLPYSVILSSSSSSFWDVLLDPFGVSQKIARTLSDASPVKILVAATPALIALFFGAWLPSRFLSTNQDFRRRYLYVTCYSFGFQSLCITTTLVFLMLGDKKIAPLLAPSWLLNNLPDGFFFVPYAIVAYGLLHPVISITLLSTRALKSTLGWRRWIAYPAGVALCLAVIGVTAWLGVLPGRIDQHLHPDPVPGVTLIQPIAVTETPTSATLRLTATLTNTLKGPIVLGRDSVKFNGRLNGGPIFPANLFTLHITKWQDGDAPVMSLQPGESKWFVAGTNLDYEDLISFGVLRATSSNIEVRYSIAPTVGTDVLVTDWTAAAVDRTGP